MKSVQEHLKILGISPALAGFEALDIAIQLVVEDRTIMRGRITKVLYPEVAKRMGSTAPRVERAMRYAIETSFEHAPLDVLQKYFGNTSSVTRGGVTVSTYIVTIANIVRE